MTTLFLEMPEDRKHLPVWLERVLLSPDLPRLVAELKVVHGVPPERLSLSDALSPHSQIVLESGLGRLPGPVFSRLLKQADLLLELRDWVLESGGSYWDTIEPVDALSSSAQRILDHFRKTRVSKTINEGQRSSLAKGSALFLAIAASVAIFVAWHWYEVGKISQLLAQAIQHNEQLRHDNELLQQRPSVVPAPVPLPASGWGFTRREDLASLEGDRAKLTKLSGLALEWGKKQPQNSLELAKRLLEFRQGCSSLLLNPPPLTKPQQVWFAARCGDWATAIEEQLHVLESGADFSKAMERANALSVSIAKELADRAKTASASG